MKNKTIYLIALIAILSFNACTKEEIDNNEIMICLLEDGIESTYYNNSNLDSNFKFVKGNNRMFVASKKTSFYEKRYIFIAPSNTNSFKLNINDIKKGLVKNQFICPTCFAITQYAIDGYVKGDNITSEIPSDKANWMIDAKVIFTTDLSQPNNPKFRDTVCIKQIFYPVASY